MIQDEAYRRGLMKISADLARGRPNDLAARGEVPYVPPTGPSPEVHEAAELFPLSEGKEFAALVADIRTNGLNEPVWLYKDPERGNGDVLLDGRNRWRACLEAGVEVKTRYYIGNNPIAFSISQNLKRRHLDTGQRAAIALKVEPLLAKEAAKRKAQAPGQPRGQKQAPSVVTAKMRGETAAASAAALVGVSARSVEQLKSLRRHTPDLAEKVRSGDMTLGRAGRIARDRIAEDTRVAEASEAAARKNTALRCEMREGRFQDVLSDLRNIDAIITDPPYQEAALPLLRDLGQWADKVLKPDGLMAILYGETYLPEALRMLEGGRPYRWTACYLTEGPAWVSHPRKVFSNWKPILVFGGTTPRFADVFRATGDAAGKERHRRGQSFDAFVQIIERLTKPGATIADPFAGGGTTLLAAKATGRHSIGCDVDPECVRRSREGRAS